MGCVNGIPSCNRDCLACEERAARRERIATAVLPMLVKGWMAENAATEALKYADALIAELDK